MNICLLTSRGSAEPHDRGHARNRVRVQFDCACIGAMCGNQLKLHDAFSAFVHMSVTAVGTFCEHELHECGMIA